MKEDFKKWLCELAGIEYHEPYDPMGNGYGIKTMTMNFKTLIKAKWAVEGKNFEVAQKELERSLLADYEFKKNK